MPLFTSFCRRCAAGLLPGLLLAFTSQAQTVNWRSARTAGEVALNVGVGALDAAGNSYELGAFRGTATVGGVTLTSRGDVDDFLAKYAPDGTLLWIRQLGSTDVDQAFDVALDGAGNAYVTGRFRGPALPLSNGLQLSNTTQAADLAYIVRFSPQGTPEWAQQSSTGDSSGLTIGADAAGRVYVAGHFGGALTLGTASTSAPANTATRSIYLARLSAATGAVQALQTAVPFTVVGGTSSFGLPRLTVAPTGETYLTCGFSQPSPILPAGTLTSRGGNDAFVAKYSPLGAFEWVQQIGSTANDRITSGAVDAAGNLYLAGSFGGPAAFGSASPAHLGGTDAFVARYSPAGALQWVQAGGSSANDVWNCVRLDAAGAPCVAGSFSATAQYGTSTLTSAGATDVAVAGYSPQGQLRWVQQAGGSGADAAYFAGFDGPGSVFVRGQFAATSTFGAYSLSTANATAAFHAQLGGVLNARTAQAERILALYPNPAHNLLHLPSLPASTRLQLVDALGRVARETVVTPAATVSVRGLRPGLYSLRATDAAGKSYAGRVVVE